MMPSPQTRGPRQTAVRVLLSVLLSGLLGCVSTVVATANPLRALTSDGRLRDTLTITEQQSGFAGITGVTWSIDVDGKYRAVRFINEKIDPPHQHGQLSPEQLRTLGHTLETELSPLPDRLGREAEINPRELVIRFGPRSWSLALPAGQSSGEAFQEYSVNKNDPRYRFLRVVRLVLDTVGE